jgi:hypothetical protein
MASATKKRYVVVTAKGEVREITASRVEKPDTVTIAFFSGEEQIAEFRGYQEFHPA